MKWERRLNFIRGKHASGPITPDDIDFLFAYIEQIARKLDEADLDDALGPEGWRQYCNVE